LASVKNREKSSNTKELEAAIINYHINERLPINKMNSVHFNKLIDGDALRSVGVCIRF